MPTGPSPQSVRCNPYPPRDTPSTPRPNPRQPRLPKETSADIPSRWCALLLFSRSPADLAFPLSTPELRARTPAPETLQSGSIHPGCVATPTIPRKLRRSPELSAVLSSTQAIRERDAPPHGSCAACRETSDTSGETYRTL